MHIWCVSKKLLKKKKGKRRRINIEIGYMCCIYKARWRVVKLYLVKPSIASSATIWHSVNETKCNRMPAERGQTREETRGGEVKAESANCAWFCFANLHSRTVRLTTWLLRPCVWCNNGQHERKKNHQQPCQTTATLWFFSLLIR